MKGPAVEGRGSSKRLGIARPKHSARGASLLPDPAKLKELVDLRSWLREHHDLVNGQGFTRCPNETAHGSGVDDPPHDNCFVYDDHIHCFACGYHADIYELAVDLGVVRTTPGTSRFVSALRYVAGLTGNQAPTQRSPARGSPRHSQPSDVARRCTRAPVECGQERACWRAVEAQLGQPLPKALQGRGFVPVDRSTLGLLGGAQEGTWDDGLFPVLGPDGLIVTVRRRLAMSLSGAKYLPAQGFSGAESPPWCSPCVECGSLFIVEGELNGMACWLALNGQAAVMGVCGTGGSLWYEPISGRDVCILADAGTPGEAAARRWSRTAHHAGARTVSVLPPWPDGDACDVAGVHGRKALRERLS